MKFFDNQLEIREVAYDSAEYKQMLQFRNELMRIPIGHNLFDEDLAREVEDHHIGVYCGQKLIGVCIITPLNPMTARMRQVVIEPSCRKMGIGRTMMLFAEHRAIELGISRLILDSRLTAMAFYEKLGYRKVGHKFMELGLPHYLMEKILRA